MPPRSSSRSSAIGVEVREITPSRRRFALASPIEGEAEFMWRSNDLPPPFAGEAASVKRAGGGPRNILDKAPSRGAGRA